MLALNDLIFGAFLIAGIVSALAIYLSENVFKSAIALAVTFTVISLSLLLLNQAVISVLQLLIIVGGISTYLVVAVASESHKYTWPTDLRIFAVTSILILAAAIYMVFPIISGMGISSPSIYIEFQQTMQSYQVMIYFVVVLMFAAAIGSMAVIKAGLNKNKES